MSKPLVDIVIPSFNGRRLLEKNLPRVIKHSPSVNQIIVVSDGGQDETVSFLKKEYPQVKIIRNQTNLGFTRSINKAIATSSADFVVLLNNDVYPTNNYLKSALTYFDQPDVFAVTFNEQHSAPPRVSWRRGKFHFTRVKDKSKPRYSAWPSGGSAIIRRSHWQQLHGFNPIYSPGYWEDIDLGWRAWQSGYRIIFDPQAKVVHHHQSTFDQLDKKHIQRIKERNELLFTWLNIHQFSLRLSHFLFLFGYTFTHPGYVRIIFMTLFSLPQVGQHFKQSPKTELTDRQIIALVNQTI